jgi:hypothetical protein
MQRKAVKGSEYQGLWLEVHNFDFRGNVALVDAILFYSILLKSEIVLIVI